MKRVIRGLCLWALLALLAWGLVTGEIPWRGWAQ